MILHETENGLELSKVTPGDLDQEGRFTVAEAVKIIGDSAFSRCRALTHITLPEGLILNATR